MRYIFLPMLALLMTLSPPSSADPLSNPTLDEAVESFLANDLYDARTQLEALLKRNPDLAEARGWLAETLRRLDEHDLAMETAAAALEDDPCQTVAHTVLGDILFFGFGGGPEKKPDYERARAHFQKAAECDPENGSPWLTLWTESMRTKDADLERESLEALGRTGFFTPAALAYARWMMRDLPENAIFITNGDMDTYPPCMLQVTEGLRTDVLIVNRSLLNADWYAQAVAERHGLPLPKGDLRAHRDENGMIVYPNQIIIRHWLEHPERVGRPLAFAVTVAFMDYLPEMSDHLEIAGGYFFYRPDAEGPSVDAETISRGLEAVDMEVMAGSMAGEQDRSPIRRRGAYSLQINPVAAALRASMERLNAGRLEDAGELLVWAETFLDRLPFTEEHPLRGNIEQIRTELRTKN